MPIVKVRRRSRLKLKQHSTTSADSTGTINNNDDCEGDILVYEGEDGDSESIVLLSPAIPSSLYSPRNTSSTTNFNYTMHNNCGSLMTAETLSLNEKSVLKNNTNNFPLDFGTNKNLN